MSLQQFPQHLGPALTARDYPNVIKGGKSVVAKVIADQAAYDALLAQVTADYDAAVATKEKADFDDKKAFKALALTVLDGINALRGQHGLGDITPAQFRTAFRDKYDSL